MQLHDLLADLAGFDGAGVLELRPSPRRSPVEVTSVVHDSREVAPGRAVLLHPRSGHRRARATRPRRSRAGAVALLVEEWLPLDVPQARVGRCARCSARSRRASTASRRSRCGCSASPAPTARPPPPTCSSRSRNAAGDDARRDRHGRGARRRPGALDRAHDARGDRAAGDARHDARRRCRHGRDGGLVARARPAPGRRDELRRDLLHQPLARSPRLSRLGRRVLRRQGAVVHAGVHAPRRGARR